MRCQFFLIPFESLIMFRLLEYVPYYVLEMQIAQFKYGGTTCTLRVSGNDISAIPAIEEQVYQMKTSPKKCKYNIDYHSFIQFNSSIQIVPSRGIWEAVTQNPEERTFLFQIQQIVTPSAMNLAIVLLEQLITTLMVRNDAG